MLLPPGREYDSVKKKHCVVPAGHLCKVMAGKGVKFTKEAPKVSDKSEIVSTEECTYLRYSS